MMRKRRHLVLWWLLATAVPASPGNVLITTLGPTQSAEDSAAVTSIEGSTLLPVGSGYVAAGTFTISDAEICTAIKFGPRAQVIAGFQQFGSAGGITEFAGIVTWDASAPLKEGDGFVGKPIYAVIGNHNTLASSTSMVIYKSDSVFMADNPISEYTVPLYAAKPGQFLAGGIGGLVTQPDFGAEVTAIHLGSGLDDCIPEPEVTGLLLVAIGFAGFMRRRSVINTT